VSLALYLFSILFIISNTERPLVPQNIPPMDLPSGKDNYNPMFY
jgi:hypothetical protein